MKTLFFYMMLLIIAFALSMNTHAEIFSDDFNTNTGMWSSVSNAHIDYTNGYAILTDNVGKQAGIVWLNKDIQSDFTVEFKFKSGPNTASGGDGFVFMFYKKKDYTPKTAGWLGFHDADKNPVPGYGIEFDEYNNAALFSESTKNHIALIKDSVGNHLVTTGSDSRVSDNQWHNVKVVVATSTITVYLDGGQVLTWTGAINTTYSGMGFSAGTWSAINQHVIDNFKITTDTQQVQCQSDSSCGLCQKCVSGSCVSQSAGEDTKNECPGSFGSCAGNACDGSGKCQYLSAGKHSCGNCQLCTGSKYSCSNVPLNSDPFNDCSALWTGCAGSCIRTGMTGNCNGAGSCASGSSQCQDNTICSTGSCVSSGYCRSDPKCLDNRYKQVDNFRCDAGVCSYQIIPDSGIQDCGINYWEDTYRCAGIWKQRLYHSKGCSNSACQDSTSWENWETHCTNGVKDCDETSKDCGGSCDTCSGQFPTFEARIISPTANQRIVVDHPQIIKARVTNDHVYSVGINIDCGDGIDQLGFLGDNGKSYDLLAKDGYYAGLWTPNKKGQCIITLEVSGKDSVQNMQVTVIDPAEAPDPKLTILHGELEKNVIQGIASMDDNVKETCNFESDYLFDKNAYRKESPEFNAGKILLQDFLTNELGYALDEIKFTMKPDKPSNTWFHDAIYGMGKSLGYKFKPWEAVKDGRIAESVVWDFVEDKADSGLRQVIKNIGKLESESNKVTLNDNCLSQLSSNDLNWIPDLREEKSVSRSASYKSTRDELFALHYVLPDIMKFDTYTLSGLDFLNVKDTLVSTRNYELAAHSSEITPRGWKPSLAEDYNTYLNYKLTADQKIRSVINKFDDENKFVSVCFAIAPLSGGASIVIPALISTVMEYQQTVEINSIKEDFTKISDAHWLESMDTSAWRMHNIYGYILGSVSATNQVLEGSLKIPQIQTTELVINPQNLNIGETFDMKITVPVVDNSYTPGDDITPVVRISKGMSGPTLMLIPGAPKTISKSIEWNFKNVPVNIPGSMTDSSDTSIDISLDLYWKGLLIKTFPRIEKLKILIPQVEVTRKLGNFGMYYYFIIENKENYDLTKLTYTSISKNKLFHTSGNPIDQSTPENSLLHPYDKVLITTLSSDYDYTFYIYLNGVLIKEQAFDPPSNTSLVDLQILKSRSDKDYYLPSENLTLYLDVFNFGNTLNDTLVNVSIEDLKGGVFQTMESKMQRIPSFQNSSFNYTFTLANLNFGYYLMEIELSYNGTEVAKTYKDLVLEPLGILSLECEGKPFYYPNESIDLNFSVVDELNNPVNASLTNLLILPNGTTYNIGLEDLEMGWWRANFQTPPMSGTYLLKATAWKNNYSSASIIKELVMGEKSSINANLTSDKIEYRYKDEVNLSLRLFNEYGTQLEDVVIVGSIVGCNSSYILDFSGEGNGNYRAYFVAKDSCNYSVLINTLKPYHQEGYKNNVSFTVLNIPGVISDVELDSFPAFGGSMHYNVTVENRGGTQENFRLLCTAGNVTHDTSLTVGASSYETFADYFLVNGSYVGGQDYTLNVTLMDDNSSVLDSLSKVFTPYHLVNMTISGNRSFNNISFSAQLFYVNSSSAVNGADIDATLKTSQGEMSVRLYESDNGVYLGLLDLWNLSDKYVNATIVAKKKGCFLASANKQFEIPPLIPPEINVCKPNSSTIFRGDNLSLTQNISPGTFPLDHLLFEVNRSYNYSASPSMNASYWTNLNTSNMFGNYSLRCWANDTQGNTISLDGPSFAVVTSTTTTTTSTTTTSSSSTLPVHHVLGLVTLANSDTSIPNASIRITCDGVSKPVGLTPKCLGTADNKGFFDLYVTCQPYSRITVYASSGPINLSVNGSSGYYGGGNGSVKTSLDANASAYVTVRIYPGTSSTSTTTTTTTKGTTSSTTSTTTTTLQSVSVVKGTIYAKNTCIPVPYANISVKCQKNGLVYNASADKKGNYELQINCSENSRVRVKASSGPAWLSGCKKIYFNGGSGKSSVKIWAGKAKVNVELKEKKNWDLKSLDFAGECSLYGDEEPCEDIALDEIVGTIQQWTVDEAELEDIIDLIDAWTNKE